MLKYLQHSEIDLALWDDCVQHSAQNVVYATSGYLNISTGKSWNAVVEVRNGKYVSVFPAPCKQRLGYKFTYQPLQLQQLGLFNTPESEYLLVTDYLKVLAPEFPKIYLQLNTQNTFSTGHLPEGFSTVPRVTYLLELAAPYETLKAQYSTNLKRNLKKAKKKNYQITTSNNVTDLIKLYRQTRGRELKDLKNRHYLLFEKQYHYLLQNALAEIREIKHEGNLVAAAFFLLQAGKPVFLFSAASEAGKKHGAMAFIIDEFIRENAGSATVLDFEGGSIPNLARFYGSFGAKPVTYLSVSRNLLPWYVRWFIK